MRKGNEHAALYWREVVRTLPQAGSRSLAETRNHSSPHSGLKKDTIMDKRKITVAIK